MTIAAGFRVSEGVLMCADTEYSGTGVKLKESKLFRVPYNGRRAAVLSFSGNASLAVPVVQRCVHHICVTELTGHRDIADAVAAIVEDEYRRHVSPTPDITKESAYEILLGAWSSHDGHGLYSTWHGSMTEHAVYRCVGAYWLGDYLIGPLLRPTLDLEWAKAIAAYVTAKAKERADGCGGLTEMVVLRTDGEIDNLSQSDVERLEESLMGFDAESRRLLFRLVRQEDEEFAQSLATFVRSALFERIRLHKTSIPRINSLNQRVADALLADPPCVS